MLHVDIIRQAIQHAVDAPQGVHNGRVIAQDGAVRALADRRDQARIRRHDEIRPPQQREIGEDARRDGARRPQSRHDPADIVHAFQTKVHRNRGRAVQLKRADLLGEQFGSVHVIQRREGFRKPEG
ncbi:hypothetical protein [Candidatus Flexifilum breve]|uniref:hypothetical protein n=1 Tax=Candidatus Flexifilum breve TaxID=3140694 RepID=UPI003312FED2